MNLETMFEKMEKTFENFEDTIRNIRTGTITSSFIDTFKIPYYGQNTPIKHLAHTTNEKGLVMIKPFDLSIIALIEKTLRDAGLNAYLFSKSAIAVSVPPINGEERQKVKNRVEKLGEDAKISIRNIRKQFRKTLEGTEDQKKQREEEIQKATDAYIDSINGTVIWKCKEIDK